jgi:hypothetical protein
LPWKRNSLQKLGHPWGWNYHQPVLAFC